MNALLSAVLLDQKVVHVSQNVRSLLGGLHGGLVMLKLSVFTYMSVVLLRYFDRLVPS